MKKFLLTCVAAIAMAANANAQLAEGSVFPYPGGASGHLTAVNAPFTGQGFNLDSISNAGYTIFIDISATWCYPCWNYHSGKQLDTLWAQHGPTGMPGVNASTTNDVYVFFVQGEATSHLGELYDCCGATVGSSTVETPYATSSQGNWVAGTPFPMIDDTTSSDANYGTNAIDAAWHIAFFPTVYMICRDHLVHNLTQPSYTAAYAAALADCPSTAPASGANIDAKASVYGGSNYFICNANPSVTFQNYSTTTSISTATVTVTDGSGATVATVPYTGAAIAPFGLATVAVPLFPGSSFGGYKYTVNVTGDINTANNGSKDSVFKVYTASNVGTIPFSDNLMGAITYKYDFPSDGSIGLPNPAWAGCPNPAGVTTNRYLLFDYPGFAANAGNFHFIVGNFNTDHLDSVKFQFDESYAVYNSNPSDNMSVEVSHNCGATWLPVWTATGAALETHASVSAGWIPTGASDWQHITVNIPVTDSSNNMMIRLSGTSTSSYGNYGWVTNLALSANNLAVNKVLSDNGVTIAPNPANEMVNISLTLTEGANIQVQVIDALGRIVNTVNRELSAGAQKIELSTANLPTGVYNVKVATGNSMVVKKLSVIK